MCGSLTATAADSSTAPISSLGLLRFTSELKRTALRNESPTLTSRSIFLPLLSLFAIIVHKEENTLILAAPSAAMRAQMSRSSAVGSRALQLSSTSIGALVRVSRLTVDIVFHKMYNLRITLSRGNYFAWNRSCSRCLRRRWRRRAASRSSIDPSVVRWAMRRPTAVYFGHLSRGRRSTALGPVRRRCICR